MLSIEAAGFDSIASSRHELEVLPAPPRPKLEAVSPRLKKSLIHSGDASGGGSLVGLRFSPDGKRIIAGDYPGGIVQTWDARTGEPLTAIETGYGYRGSAEYFFVSPDWQKLYVGRIERTVYRIEQDGKKSARENCTGDVRIWSLAHGELIEAITPHTARGFLQISLSPDGRTLYTETILSGDAVDGSRGRASLWALETKQERSLPAGSQLGLFSPDGKSIAVSSDDGEFTKAIKLFDVDTAREVASIPIAEPAANAYACSFSGDGRKLIGEVCVYPDKGNYARFQSFLKIWDATSGNELASFPAEEEQRLFRSGCALSNDGKSLAAVNLRAATPRLHVYDLERNVLAWKVDLAPKADATHVYVMWQPAFSPDDKWIAISSQLCTNGGRNSGRTSEDFAQARIHLVEVATKTVRESLISPPGYVVRVCFSPDGKTLASTAKGKVHLWDLETPLGSPASESNEK